MVKLSHNQQAWVAGNLAGLAAVGLVSIGLMYHGFGIELDNIEGQLAQFDADVDRLSRHVVALENDWLILLNASFTNAFFGAMLGVILFIYFALLGLSRKQAVFLSLVSIFATNLFVYTKHSFAHMMFAVFLTLSFLLIKLYSTTRRKYLLIISGLSFGVVMITYNPTFLLAIPPFFLYYLLLGKHK